MRYFTLNGVDSRGHFLTNAIEREYLPSIQVPSTKVPNRAGAISHKKNQIGTTEIDVHVSIMADNNSDLRERVRALTAFLIYEEDKELIFSDEPDKFYRARFNNSSTSLKEIASLGEGTLHFTCFDPFAYRITENTELIVGQESIFINDGNYKTFPLLRVVPSALDIPFIKITNVTTGQSLLYNDVFPAWDALVIDNDTNRAYHETTGENLMEHITFESEFFPLIVGENMIRIERENGDATGLAGQLRLYWRERFL